MAAMIHPLSSAESSNCDTNRSGRVSSIFSRHRRIVFAVTPALPRVGLMPSSFNFVATAIFASLSWRKACPFELSRCADRNADQCAVPGAGCRAARPAVGFEDRL